MWLITLRSHTHSRDASYSAMISEWLVEVAVRVYLEDFHEIAVPPCRNTNPVWDLPLWGSDR
jgi:hypothetical protein